MIIKKPKKLYSLAFGIYSLLNVILYLLFHFIVYLPSSSLTQTSEALQYIRYFFTEAAEFLMPTVGAVLLLIGYADSGHPRSLLRAFAISAPRFFFYFPYYYLYFTAYGNDFIESSAYSLLSSAIGIILLWGHTVLLYLLMAFVTKRFIARELSENLPPQKQANIEKGELAELKKLAYENLPSYIGEKAAFNLNAPIAAGVFSTVFAEFIYCFILELFDTVSYLIEYSGTYKIGEIIYITFSFVFLVGLLLLSQVICCKIKDIIVKLR